MFSPSVRLTIVLATAGMVSLHAEPAGAECGSPVTTAQLVGALERSEWAYGEADLNGFSDATQQLRYELPCLSEELPRNVAARVHRAFGLRGFVDRDPDVSTRSFAAARSIEPAYGFPTSMVPEGNPVLADYNAIPVESGEYRDVLTPADGYLVFDGRPGLARPVSWPSLVQFVSSEGEVTDTIYLWPDQALPVYEIAAQQPDSDPTGGGSTAGGDAKLVSVPLLAVAGGLAAASGALFLASRSVHGTYYDPDTAVDRLDGLRASHNALVWGARGASAGAVVVGAGAFVVVRW